MATTAGVGHSFHRNPATAGREAALRAMEGWESKNPDFVFVFATVGYNQETLIRAIREATAGAPLSGCSGEGIITRETVAETNFGVAVMAISSDEFGFHNACVRELAGGSHLAGELLAAELEAHLDAEGIATFLFADGLVFNFDTFRSAFEDRLGNTGVPPVFGGLAADNWSSHKTYQYHNDEVFSEGVSAVVISGKGNVACGVNHGCVPIGSKRTITRCNGNIIREIDGIPALDALKDYFEEDWKRQWNKTSLNLCLGFMTPEHIRGHYEDYIIRYMMAKNDEEGSVTIQSDVRDGTPLWIVRRDKELMTSGLRLLARDLNDEMGSAKPKFAVQFECVGRGKVVFREREKAELITSLQSDLGGEIPWIGFYSYGEIGPVAGFNCFHNFTSVVTVIY
ncbi:MAG TPA: FIST N-terminal domain-containing protein [Geobacteraceae bacterium]